MYLNRSMISLNSKRELRTATRLSTALLVWDTLFRFKVVHKLLALMLGSSSSAYKTVATAYSISFACFYVGGMSLLFAFSYERTRISHFRLGFCSNPLRVLSLACGRGKFTREELSSYDQVCCVHARCPWCTLHDGRVSCIVPPGC